MRYAETDQMGVVYHANYIVWMEVGRVEAMRAAGVDYAQMEREGVVVAVVGVEVDYRVAARYDEVVEVGVRVTEALSRKMRIEYEIRRATDGVVLATGATRHLFVSKELRPMRCPDKYLDVFRGKRLTEN
ncbi:MAG: acyl-CoA thioesterase [Acidobacteriota bacterium]